MGNVVEAGVRIAGRYEVEAALGRGAMGEVLRVVDSRSGRRLALKRARSRGKRARRRSALLEREYHTLAQLAHPRIIEVYDYGIDEHGPYYTMELLDGDDLRTRGQLPWREACSLLRDVASSLAILHSRRLLHRDVSARNVRCTEDGRAKLIDFGAMAPMGVVKDMAGTPPFVPPEALQMQALDGRADLYSLGALAYYVLTGRHAYPARKLPDLRDAWRSDPLSPRRLVADVPEGLDALVMQLLSLDRSARPQTAAEVMARLCTIADLPIEEREEVTRAYLSTPTLVGRDGALIAVRKRVISLARGQGCTLLIDGAPGSGRSRFLDACVLEGKLLGATVLRADTSDVTADWGVAGALAAQLLDAHPEAAIEAARLSFDVLGHVVPGLREPGTTLENVPSRSHLLRALRDWITRLAPGLRLMIAVDDVDAIDEPSAALLAALSHKIERYPMSLVCTRLTKRDSESSPPLALLTELAVPIHLENLAPEHTEALMRSVFGDARSLSLVAARVHALSHGNPRAAMELAQHLLDRGLARYEAGNWTLPTDLGEGDLPEALSDTLAGALARVSDDARELCDVLCVADTISPTLSDYPRLVDYDSHRRLFCALDELVSARILIVEQDRYRFSQRGLLKVLSDAMPQLRRRALHARIAEQLSELPARDRVHHLLRGGREREALELLCVERSNTLPVGLEVLVEALEVGDRFGLTPLQRHRLLSQILTRAPLRTDLLTFKRYLPQVLRQLERDSGLLDYRELLESDEGRALERDQLLSRALDRTQARYEQTPEAERVYSFPDAIRELAQLCGNLCSISLQAYDAELLDAMPSLAPLIPLSPAVGSVQKVLDAARDTVAGRVLLAREAYVEILLALEQPDRAGFDPDYADGVYYSLHYLLGLLEASMGADAAETHARVLEQHAEHRVSAWRVRVALYLNQGNATQARRARRRAELLQIQESSEQRYLGTSAGFELIAHGVAGDLTGVKQALEGLYGMAEKHRGWRAVLHLGRAMVRWLQGDLTGALQALEPGLAEAPAGKHPYFARLASAHIDLLSELGQHEAALARSRDYLEACEREKLTGLIDRVMRAAALAHARAGDHEQAARLAERALAHVNSLGIGGLTLGTVYETCAQVRLLAGDEQGFSHYADLCAVIYKQGNNPALAAKFSRLMESARRISLRPPPISPAASALLEMTQTAGGGLETIQSAMLECIDDADRARTALTILLQHCAGVGGHLLAVTKEGLEPLASLRAGAPGERLLQWAGERLEEELADDITATADGAELPLDGPPGSSSMDTSSDTYFTDESGQTHEAVFLSTGQRVVALLVLALPVGPRDVPSRELLRDLAEQLQDDGVFEGIQI